jgi:hypothetical protein
MLSEAAGTKLGGIIGYKYLMAFEVSIDCPNEMDSSDEACNCSKDGLGGFGELDHVKVHIGIVIAILGPTDTSSHCVWKCFSSNRIHAAG